jgi:hypothetical protein
MADEEVKQEEMEARAKLQGWVPEDQYTGEAGSWKSAEDFLAFGEQIQPILRECLRSSETKLVEMTNKINELTEVIANFSEYHKKTEERSYKKALRDLKALKEEAVEEADKNKVKEIDDEIDGLKESQQEVGTVKPKGDPIIGPEFIEWQSKNDWYGKDMELSVYADQVAPFIDKSLKGAAFFKAVKDKVEEKYPEKFGNPNREKPGSVEAGSGGGGGQGKKSYSDLPADAKKACDQFVKDGLLTKEQYIKEYEWE